MSTIEQEMPQRLLDNAVAFYEAGQRAKAEQKIFICEGVDPRSLGAPQVVCLAFAVELFLKLIGFLEDGKMRGGRGGHDLKCLLESLSAGMQSEIEEKYIYGSVAKVAEEFADLANAFSDWRYVHEKEFLIASPDTLITLAEILRTVVRDQRPNLVSVFEA